MIPQIRLGNSALILDPWAIGRRKPPPQETWSPYVGSRDKQNPNPNKWARAKMRRDNKRMNLMALAALGIVKSDHVLEIGYGSGEALTLAAHMANKGFAAGIDRSMDMLQDAFKRAKRSRAKNVSVLRGDASWLPWSACSFDKVFCVDGVTDWPCTRSALEEAFRVLRPGGTLLIVEPIGKKLTKSKALALSHLLTVVGFEDLQVSMTRDGRHEVILIRAIRL